jgi:hypothetical protein
MNNQDNNNQDNNNQDNNNQDNNNQDNAYLKYTTFIIIYIIVIINNTSKLEINTSNIYLAPFAIILGYLIGDFLSGLYHYFMDTFDIFFLRDYHNNFRAHHDNPLSMEEYPFIESIGEILPIGIVLGIISSYFFAEYPLLLLTIITANIIMCSAQVAHRLAHRRTHEFDENGNKQYHIPEFVKFLQDKNIILNNKEHRKHHITEVMNYCISNNNTSILLDKLIDILQLPISTYKNSNNIHTPVLTSEKYNLIDKYLPH